MLLKARMIVLTYAVLRMRHWLPGLGCETRGLRLVLWGLDYNSDHMYRSRHVPK